MKKGRKRVTGIVGLSDLNTALCLDLMIMLESRGKCKVDCRCTSLAVLSGVHLPSLTTQDPSDLKKEMGWGVCTMDLLY